VAQTLQSVHQALRIPTLLRRHDDSSRIGAAVPAHAAAGKVLLAALTARERDLLNPALEIAPLTGRRTVATRAALDAEIDAAERLGLARNIGESEDGVYALGIAIHRPVGRPICSLTIAGPVSRIEVGTGAELLETEATLLARLREAGAATIEAELRY
jgi:DNA-binding IclR family transcriptional regulator